CLMGRRLRSGRGLVNHVMSHLGHLAPGTRRHVHGRATDPPRQRADDETLPGVLHEPVLLVWSEMGMPASRCFVIAAARIVAIATPETLRSTSNTVMRQKSGDLTDMREH